jgi:hypothetical protein
MTSTHDTSDDGAVELPELIEKAVLSCPAVATLDRGRFGTVTSYLPGRQVVGVATGGAGEPVEVSVVLYLSTPVPAAVDDVRERVRTVAGDVPVDVTVADLVMASEAAESEAGTHERR